MKFEDYKNIDAYNASMLKHFLHGEKTGMHKLQTPQTESEALINGRYFHEKIEAYLKNDPAILSNYAILEDLERERFGDNVNRRTKNYREWRNSVELSLIDRNIDAAANSLLGSDVFAELTRHGGENEITLLADYQQDIKLKGRLDYLINMENIIVDWKTTHKLPTKKNIEHAIRDYNYMFSAAFYSFLCYKNFAEWFDFIFVFVQTVPPYDIGLYTIIIKCPL